MQKIAHTGFTLIEVSIAVLLLVMTFGALITLLILGQDSSVSAKNDLIASQLAEEGIKLVGFVRSENYAAAAPAFSGLYNTLTPNDPYYFLIDSARIITPASAGVSRSAPLKILDSLYGYSADPTAQITVFHRLITTHYHSDAGIYLDVTVQVYWKDGTRSNTISVSGQLSDWQ